MFNSNFDASSSENANDATVVLHVNRDASTHQLDFSTDSIAGYFTFEVKGRRGYAFQPILDSEGNPEQLVVSEGILTVTFEGGLKEIKVIPTDLTAESTYSVNVSSK